MHVILFFPCGLHESEREGCVDAGLHLAAFEIEPTDDSAMMIESHQLARLSYVCSVILMRSFFFNIYRSYIASLHIYIYSHAVYVFKKGALSNDDVPCRDGAPRMARVLRRSKGVCWVMRRLFLAQSSLSRKAAAFTNSLFVYIYKYR